MIGAFRHTLAAAVIGLVAAPAAMADEINIYSTRQPSLIEPLLEAFTAETGIKTNIAFLNKGIIERLQAEGSRSPADIILTVGVTNLVNAQQAGVTQPVVSETLTANIPTEFRDADGHWYGVTTRARIVYASKDRVAEGEVTTYEDLADPKWKGRICTRPGTHGYNLALVAAMLHHHGEDYTRTWLEGVKANLARKPQGNDRAQVKAIWAGECDISLGNTYYMGKMLEDDEQKAWANSVNVLFPVFEGGGSHVNISGVAMTAAAKNRDNALAFMEFLASAKAQEIYAEVNYEYPVAPGSTTSELVKGWGDLTADSVSVADLAGLRADALRLVEEVNFDG